MSSSMIALTLSRSAGAVGASLIIVTHFMLTQAQRASPGRWTLLVLSIVDLLLAIGYLVEAILHFNRVDLRIGVTCAAVGMYTQYFGLAAILWTTALSFNVHVGTSVRAADLLTRRYWIALHVLCWLPPAIPLAVDPDVFGWAGNLCWIKREAQWERFVFYLAPLVASFLFGVAVHFRVRRRFVSFREQANALLLEADHEPRGGNRVLTVPTASLFK